MLVEATVCKSIFFSMDNFSGYNYIKMHPHKVENTALSNATFITYYVVCCLERLSNLSANNDCYFHDILHDCVKNHINDTRAMSK